MSWMGKMASLLLTFLIAEACATEPKSASKEASPQPAQLSRSGEPVTKVDPENRGSESAEHGGFFEDQNLKKFVGRTVGDWVTALPVKYQDAYPIDEPPGKLRGFSFVFPNSIKVEVFCHDLKHVKKFNAEREWNLDLFLKETISEIAARKQ
ncbi:MAG TPA: hypothetical protein VJN18_03605 [Polyangiaceae bacterium]|nr:hypothetical protein [Polyangiaceae bacterium]